MGHGEANGTRVNEHGGGGADNFGRAVSKIVVAQICESVGFQSSKESALDALADIAIRYLCDLGKIANSYANLTGRTECNVFDIIRALEVLEASQGFPGAGDVGHCLVRSGTMKEIATYVDLAEEIPFAQPVPRFPVLKNRRLIPSFEQMGENPLGQHIPTWLPALPDPHTYIHSPMWNERNTEPRLHKLEHARQRRKAERSLLSLQQRLARDVGYAGASTSAAVPPLVGGDGNESKQVERNPFLEPPLHPGEKDVSPIVFPGKILDERGKGDHASVLEAFAPAIEAVKKSGFSEYGEDERRVLPGIEARPAIQFKFRTAKKYFGESLDLSLKKAVGRPAYWFGSEDVEGTDKEKEKKWEEERKVFHGRVDSFIARMHLVQGDRRFSPWKGSVVDSVIGVFLTQNVSDHLSSSAFMSLAARFPLKSRTYSTKDKAETNIIDRQAPISILNPDDTFKWREVFGEPINNPNIASHQSENQWGSDIRGTERTLTEAQSQTLDEEFVLSQDSFDSTITQVASGIRSCSGSNSETEDPCTSCKPSSVQLSSSTHCLQMEKMTSVHEVCGLVNGCTELNEKSKHGLVEYDQLKLRYDAMKHLDFPSSTYSDSPDYLYMQSAGPATSNKLHIINDSRVPELCCFETFSEESTSSWHSTASRSAKGPEAVSKSSRTGEPAGSFGNSTKELNGECRSREARTADPYPSLSMHLTNQQHIPQPAPDIGQNHQYNCSSYQHERNNMFHLEGASSTEPVRLDEAHTKMKNATTENVPKFNKLTEKTFEAVESISATNTKKHTENRLAETNLKEQTSSHHASVAANTKSSKGKKGNSESQNWDNLRKQVESNGRKRERGNHSMDSLDYEALRKANVNVISDAIKERGMNNMLAERIQEFLNRLVREHGSIDLEWLRDVPPDQAKNYLLSIRGLGLKSVECVRLLTLHHLAFPVDTNVGRIAVRLGWVPLQPLPESLQLHLLELYPMLESIQKYLWPRLCKLDQRTLYELHYQMITFGKVFCTKSKPNCNACPMRGECRHFASAFASARLALPGPEERGIVSSTVPIPTEHPPAVVIHPMALPPPENDLNKEVGSKTGNCEPIIEEPATPELECTEISQSDIEDAFYEDPDEIPTIKLNMEEFTENLQTYMQKNMELQEGDMSKALVALTDVASIPIPKLKNVSRLRTEHQVYELPDSHPLLERLDRREPDDPSPYLLAIWTPGETANSIQPSERSCGSQEPGKLCNDETCFSCNSMREANSQTVRGTILIPCRTAMRGSFPLNGTYFQVNEMFADHDSSLNPIDVPREWIWNLPRRTVYFGTSVTTIFRGLSTEGIQYCFWKGFVCVRGFDLMTRAPRPLMARLHFPASKLAKAKNDDKR